MIQLLSLSSRSINRVCSSCQARPLLPVVQCRIASTRFWDKSNSTHTKHARQRKAKGVVGPIARHTRFQNDAEYREATSILRRYLLIGSAKFVFSGDIDSALILLRRMMDMGSKNSYENFMAACDGMFLATASIVSSDSQ